MSFLHIIKDSLQQQIHYNGNIFGNKCCRCNEGLLYVGYCNMSLCLAIVIPQVFFSRYLG